MTTSRQRAQRDAGLTLIELLLAVAILGIAVTTIVGGIGTAVIGSDYSHKQADAVTAIRSYAEAVTGTTYQACPASYAPAYTPPSGYTATISSVEYWDTTTSAFGAACPASDYGLERITLRVASTDGRDSEQLQVEKRSKATGETP